MSVGLIPAHAGKTLGRTITGFRRRAHPRSRGENCAKSALVSTSDGSSPLTRGKRPWIDPARAPDGLIPAHAGKTPRRSRIAVASPAHPRSRGENPSPPRTMTTLPWLIPAHAGKTAPWQAAFCRLAAHPRSRGENRSAATARMRAVGSSPLTRGKRRRPTRG